MHTPIHPNTLLARVCMKSSHTHREREFSLERRKLQTDVTQNAAIASTVASLPRACRWFNQYNQTFWGPPALFVFHYITWRNRVTTSGEGVKVSVSNAQRNRAPSRNEFQLDCRLFEYALGAEKIGCNLMIFPNKVGLKLAVKRERKKKRAHQKPSKESIILAIITGINYASIRRHSDSNLI